MGVLRGWTWMPSATSPAMRSIHGLTAARSIGGSGTAIAPGDHIAGRSERFQNYPPWCSRSPRKAEQSRRAARRGRVLQEVENAREDGSIKKKNTKTNQT